MFCISPENDLVFCCCLFAFVEVEFDIKKEGSNLRVGVFYHHLKIYSLCMKLIDMNNMHNFVLKLGNLKKSLSCVNFVFALTLNLFVCLLFLFVVIKHTHLHRHLFSGIPKLLNLNDALNFDRL